MLEWLLAGWDTSRPHEISDLERLHARFNYFSWVILVPLAIIVARFFKVMPKQKWPQELDSQVWWRFHWIGQLLAVLLTGVAILLLRMADVTHNIDAELHRTCGYIVLALGCFQIALGVMRGSKGGPTDLQSDGSLLGHHYRMSLRRRVFEALHKSLGYVAVGLAAFTVLQGFWVTNAPRWMWIVSMVWWLLMISLFVYFQKERKALDTYQAIWGPGLDHPGNLLPKQGWGTHRVDSYGGNISVNPEFNDDQHSVTISKSKVG